MAMDSVMQGVPRRTLWLAAGGVLFVLVVATALFFAFSPRYAVLFADLRERDLALMSEALHKKKIAFEVGADGRSLLVPEADVHKVRMQLMAQDIALQGNVGFELFNGSDLGMTEFVQKVNYQRALQGELARTIQSMDEVQSARVHLALPEQGLFKKVQARSKASVTVLLKPGASFSRAQVVGVQRLVAASVPDIAPGDVAVLDQRGVVLSSSGPSEEALDEGWIERKRSTENYLAKKASQVLDRMFGEGASLVAVDVQLAEERRTATIEEVLPGHAAHTARDQAPTGVVVRERQTTRGATPREGDAAATAPGTESSSSETEYQVGRKTEQVQTPAGGVRRIGVAVVLKATLSDADAVRVKDLVATAVGAQAQRGDTVAVTTLQRAAEGAAPAALGPQDAPAAASADMAAPATAAAREGVAMGRGAAWPLGLGALGLVVAGLLGLALWRGRSGAAPLDARERQAVLDNVQHWLATGAGREAQP